MVKKNKEICLALCLFTMIVLSLTPPAFSNEPAIISRNRPDPQKPLTLAYCSYMPFYFKGLNNEPRGILVDVWKLWSEKVGIPVNFILLPWDDVLKAIDNGSADINCLIFKSLERKQKIAFSQSLFDLTAFLYYRKNAGFSVSDLTDLPRLTIGVVTKDFTADFLNLKYPGLKVRHYRDHEDLVKAAATGKIQGFVMERPVASTYIAKHDEFKILTEFPDPVYRKPMYAGVKKGNDKIIGLINQGLSQITPQEIQKIILNWTGEKDPLVCFIQNWSKRHLSRPNPIIVR